MEMPFFYIQIIKMQSARPTVSRLRSNFTVESLLVHFKTHNMPLLTPFLSHRNVYSDPKLLSCLLNLNTTMERG